MAVSCDLMLCVIIIFVNPITTRNLSHILKGFTMIDRRCNSSEVIHTKTEPQIGFNVILYNIEPYSGL